MSSSSSVLTWLAYMRQLKWVIIDMYPWYTYTRARANVMRSSSLWLIRVRHDAHTHLHQTLMTRTCDTAQWELKSKIFGHIDLLAEILNYFVWRNQSNINQYVHMTYVHELLIIQETLTWVTDDAWFACAYNLTPVHESLIIRVLWSFWLYASRAPCWWSACVTWCVQFIFEMPHACLTSTRSNMMYDINIRSQVSI